MESYNQATALGACIFYCVPGAFWTWFLALTVGQWAHSAVSSTCHTSRKPFLVKTLLVLRPLGKPVPILSVSLVCSGICKIGPVSLHSFSCRLSLHSFTELFWGPWHILVMRASSMLSGTHQRAVSCRYDFSECIPINSSQHDLNIDLYIGWVTWISFCVWIIGDRNQSLVPTRTHHCSKCR